MDIFLSYCWNDNMVADNICDYFLKNKNIHLHRDVIDIESWDSIKKYMQSISSMDYIILIISDSYLKSGNCMYEVLEVMRDRAYRDKIFPAVINSEIYNPITRIEYVKYWQEQFKKMQEALFGIDVQNIGNLNYDLKRCQDISSNIAEFLEVVSDMNNPAIKDVSLRIEEKLAIRGLISKDGRVFPDKDSNSLYVQLHKEFKRVREQDGAVISYQAEALARKLWDEYHDGGGGIYLLDVARIRNDQSTIEKLYFELMMSTDVKICEAVKRWNKKWRQVDE